MYHSTPSHRLPTWARALTLSFPLTAALVACGGDDGPGDPLAKYKAQTLNWVACEDSALQVMANWQCTSFVAPLDYAAPEQGEITIEVSRVPAMSAQRKGAIFFNPGGPGGDGWKRQMKYLDQILKQPGASQEVMSLQAQLLNRYDLLGFNPRGTGSKTSTNTPLECQSDARRLAADESSAGRNRPGNHEALNTNQALIAQACASNPLTPFISTDATARDMDLLRSLMGDSKISYLGYSYGSWLGAWYARLFPERVDRMVLDSNTDVSADYMDITEFQPIARDTLITDFLAPYAARHPATYGLGDTPEQVRSALAAIDPWVKTSYAHVGGGKLYRSTNTADTMNHLAAARGLDQLIRALPNATDAQMAAAIEAHLFVPVDSSVSNATVRQAAQTLWDAYQSVQWMATHIGQPTQRIALGPDGDGSNNAVLFSITCNDAALSSRDLTHWQALGDTIAQQAPFFGGSNPPTQTCMYWTVTPNIQRPPLSALQGLDIMMTQSQYDIATPIPGAMKGFTALPKAHMVYVANEYTHGVFPYDTDCVDVPVLKYLLGQSPTVRQIDCPASGIALPLEQTITKSAQSPEARQRRALIDEFKKHIGPDAGQ